MYLWMKGLSFTLTPWTNKIMIIFAKKAWKGYMWTLKCVPINYREWGDIRYKVNRKMCIIIYSFICLQLFFLKDWEKLWNARLLIWISCAFICWQLTETRRQWVTEQTLFAPEVTMETILSHIFNDKVFYNSDTLYRWV